MKNDKYKIKKVAIYNRKSRDDETEEGLRKNLATLVEMCVKNNWEYEVFQEVGSSQNMNPELDRMLEKIQRFLFDAVLATEQSRLGRNDVVIAQTKQILTNYGIKLITPNKTYDLESQEDTLMSDMQAIVDKQEYLNTKRRLIRGKRQSAKEGNWVTRAPTGYKYDHGSKKLVPNEHAPIIQEIFKLYLSGMTTTDIERQFELDRILTPSGSKWDSARIAVVLANPAYKGTYIYGKTKISKIEKMPSGKPRQVKTDEEEQIIVHNAHVGIVSVEDWEKAREIRESRLTKPPGARIGKVAFTGLIKCSFCGRVHSFQRRKGKELRITSCQTRHYNEDGSYSVCKNKGGRLDKFEELFYAKFSQYVGQLERYLEQIKNNMKEETTNPADEKKALEGQIKKLEFRIDRVRDAYEGGAYTLEVAQERIKNHNVQIKKIMQQLEKLNRKSNEEQVDSLQTVFNKLKSILEGTSDLETKEINELYTKLIDHIEYKRVGDHRAKMDLTIHYK